MNYNIYYANESDADKIAQLFINNVDDSYITASEEIWQRATIEEGWSTDLYNNIKTEILKSINNSEKLILVMYNHDELVGYTLSCIKPNKCAEIEDFVVDKEYRRFGFGKKLYEETCEILREDGVKTLFLEVGHNNLKMQKFCDSVNLKETSRRYYKKLNDRT